MNVSGEMQLHALLFGLSNDLEGDLSAPLSKVCGCIETQHDPECAGTNTPAQVIFCDANPEVVGKLRETYPVASIVAVTRHPEASQWLDSIEAGATDYCAAPFEPAQLLWILQASMRASQVPVTT